MKRLLVLLLTVIGKMPLGAVARVWFSLGSSILSLTEKTVKFRAEAGLIIKHEGGEVNIEDLVGDKPGDSDEGRNCTSSSFGGPTRD